MRIETDFIGSLEIPKDALYGINSVRAKANFPFKSSFSKEWYEAIGITKKACYMTYRDFKNAVATNHPDKLERISLIEDNLLDILIETADEISKGLYYDQFIIPSVQGGAGTSINLNINEIIANASLIKIGKAPGDYEYINPIEDANVYQSTNDVIPTSLKIAVIRLLLILESEINSLRKVIEDFETENRSSLRIGYTQMQEAVPSSYGLLFSAYNDSLSRDWWRVSKCFERIKVVNLGGSALGTGISVPRFFIMEVVSTLQKLTGLPVVRSENMHDTTANLDSFVEIHGILKAHAVNLEKIASDIRLLSSDIVGNKEIVIPMCQVGSSIMPGKVNPVISEYIISISHKVYSNDVLITSLSAQGCLDLNAYLPLIGDSLIESLKLLIAADQTLRNNLFKGLIVKSNTALDKLYKSPSVTTSLSPYIGYHKATELALLMKNNDIDVFNANDILKLIDDGKLREILKPEKLLQTGFTVKDL